MINWQTRLLEIWLAGILAGIPCAASADEKTRPPNNAELESLVGEALPRPIQIVEWQAGEPPKYNLTIYAVLPKPYQPENLKSLADCLGIKGEPQRLPATFIYHPGYWIKETNPTNKGVYASLIFSETSGMIRYGSGEDNHKWDLKNHKPLAQGVPDEQEALSRTLALLPALGISTNDLEHLPDGRLKYATSTEGTWYNERNNKSERKRYIRQINIEFWQKIHDGASVLPMGSGGMLRAGYISGGRLAEIEMVFRNVKSIGQAKAKTSGEIIQMLKRGEGWSFHAGVPDKLAVTQCSLVYPQANATTKQGVLWPFYSLSVVAVNNGETNSFRIYEPLDQ